MNGVHDKESGKCKGDARKQGGDAVQCKGTRQEEHSGTRKPVVQDVDQLKPEDIQPAVLHA